MVHAKWRAADRAGEMSNNSLGPIKREAMRLPVFINTNKLLVRPVSGTCLAPPPHLKDKIEPFETFIAVRGPAQMLSGGLRSHKLSYHVSAPKHVTIRVSFAMFHIIHAEKAARNSRKRAALCVVCDKCSVYCSILCNLGTMCAISASALRVITVQTVLAVCFRPGACLWSPPARCNLRTAGVN